MRSVLQQIGTIMYYCAWPAYWVYFKVGYGRTRVLLLNEGKLLVMKQWVSAGKWTLPGGGIHKDETALNGAVREVKEETSLELDPRQLRFVGESVHRSRGLSFVYHVFVTTVGSTNVRAQRIEVSELEWIDPEQLHHKNASGDTLEAVHMARENGLLLQ